MIKLISKVALPKLSTYVLYLLIDIFFCLEIKKLSSERVGAL